MVDPKFGASGAQLSSATRRAMSRRRRLPNAGATPKLENPINRNPKPMAPKFGQAMPASLAPKESVARLDGSADNTAGSISRGVANFGPMKRMGSGGPTINRLGSAPTTPTAPVDAKFGMDINKPIKKKAMGKVEEANYGMSKAMDRGVRKALRMPPA